MLSPSLYWTLQEPVFPNAKRIQVPIQHLDHLYPSEEKAKNIDSQAQTESAFPCMGYSFQYFKESRPQIHI